MPARISACTTNSDLPEKFESRIASQKYFCLCNSQRIIIVVVIIRSQSAVIFDVPLCSWSSTQRSWRNPSKCSTRVPNRSSRTRAFSSVSRSSTAQVVETSQVCALQRVWTQSTLFQQPRRSGFGCHRFSLVGRVHQIGLSQDWFWKSIEACSLC